MEKFCRDWCILLLLFAAMSFSSAAPPVNDRSKTPSSNIRVRVYPRNRTTGMSNLPSLPRSEPLTDSRSAVGKSTPTHYVRPSSGIAATSISGRRRYGSTGSRMDHIYGYFARNRLQRNRAANLGSRYGVRRSQSDILNPLSTQNQRAPVKREESTQRPSVGSKEEKVPGARNGGKLIQCVEHGGVFVSHEVPPHMIGI